MPWLIRPLQQERALLLGVLASIALHMLVLLGLNAPDAAAPPARTLPVLTARLAPVAKPSPAAKPAPEALPAPAPQPSVVPEPPALPVPAQSERKLTLEPEPTPVPAPRKSATQPARTARKPPPLPKPPPAVAAPPAPSAPAPAASEPLPRPSATLQAKSAPSASAGVASEANAKLGNEADRGILEQYRLALIAATRRYKRYPAIAMEKGWQGRVEVSMVIGANGMLARASIKTSSGHEILDKQAIDMLRKGKTTVQIPSRLRGREFSIDVPVIFNLDDPSS